MADCSRSLRSISGSGILDRCYREVAHCEIGGVLVLVLVQINLRLEERQGQAIPKPRVAITPAIPCAFTVTFMQVVTLSCPQPVRMLWHATTKPTDPNFGG